MRPPAGNFCSSVSSPVWALMLKLLRESEGICAPSPPVSGLLMLKAESLREETVRNLESDWQLSAWSWIYITFSDQLTEIQISAPLAPAGAELPAPYVEPEYTSVKPSVLFSRYVTS